MVGRSLINVPQPFQNTSDFLLTCIFDKLGMLVGVLINAHAT